MPADSSASRIHRLAVAGLAVALATSGSVGCNSYKEIRGARDVFLAKVAAGDTEGAYALLSDDRKLNLSQAEFDTFIDHPVFRADGVYEPPWQDNPGWCLDGKVPLADGEWGIQLFFFEEGDTMKLHSLAIQEPATVQLGTMLPECGYWRGTLAGYSGPPITRATTPTFE